MAILPTQWCQENLLPRCRSSVFCHSIFVSF